jgi:hypothetical protein
VSDILNFLLTNRTVVTDDFERDQAALQATSDAIQRALLVEVATLPLSSSSGAFTYRFNPALGTSERISTNFGTFFVERAATAGRGRASFGVTFRYSDYTALDGFDLDEGTFVTTANQFADEPEPFDREYLRLRLSTATTTAFANVGVTDWLDLSVAVPLVMLRLEGERFDDFRGRETLQASAEAEVTGLADVAIRGKVHVLGQRASGLAFGGELRLPTGDREDLLGAGEVTYRGQVIGSMEGPGVAVSVIAGYAGGGVANQIDFGAGLTLAPAARFTMSVEAFGRSLDDFGQLQPVTLPHPTIQGVRTTRLAADDSSLITAAAVAGFKWNVAGNWLLNANVLMPITDRGLRVDYAPAISVEYAFGR